MAHEIGNPLTGIACLAQNLARELAEADLRERVGLILRETQRIDAIVRVLLGYSHAGAPDGIQRESVDLHACVGEAITLVRLSREAKGVPCENRVPDGVHVSGDRQRLIQVFVNLVSNACDASAPGTPVTVGAIASTHGVKVSVQDRGTGMDESTRERMFEPFYTTKPPGQGTGLGLPLGRGNRPRTRGHAAGRYEARGRDDRGGGAAGGRWPGGSGDEGGRGPRGSTRMSRILVVEDEDIIRSELARLLARTGHERGRGGFGSRGNGGGGRRRVRSGDCRPPAPGRAGDDAHRQLPADAGAGS